jgi:signal transduction histidine kinase
MKHQREMTEKLETLNEELNKKDRLKNEFLNVAAHELRAPIQPILGMAEILRQRKSGGSGEVGINNTNTSVKEDIEYLDIIIRNAKRLLRLEQNILDMTKIESKTLKLDKERFNLIEKITNVVNDFSSELLKQNIKLVFTQDSQSEPIFVNADKVRIFEVISNLLSNAIRFTVRSDERRIMINAEKRESEAIVNIKDTGPGIKPEILPKLFSKFVTNSSAGTGVGLFISKNIIEAHGGKIWAENNANNNSGGKGATISFSLPLTLDTVCPRSKLSP